SSRKRRTRCYRDWSSDVCSSDLDIVHPDPRATHDLEVRGVNEDRLGDNRPAADDEGVISRDDIEEAFWIDVLHVDFMRFPKGGRSEGRRVGKEGRSCVGRSAGYS